MSTSPSTLAPSGPVRAGGQDDGGAVSNGIRPPTRSAVDSALPHVDGDLVTPSPPPSRIAYLALLVTIVFEVTVPSLQCYWGVLLVLWPNLDLDSAANSTSTSSSTLLDLRNAGFLWTPVLFTASWSVADPWSETLGVVHGHSRICSLVGSLLVVGGQLSAALGALLSPQSPLMPLLAGIGAGIFSGIGASLVSRPAGLVLGHRWGSRAGLTLGARRFLRSLGLTMAPLAALSLGQSLGPGGALLVAALVCLPVLLAPIALTMPHKPAPAPVDPAPTKYERLKEMGWKVTSKHHDADADGDAKTEISDDGGSVGGDGGHPNAMTPPSNPSPHNAKTIVVAEVHCDGAGQRQGLSPRPEGVEATHVDVDLHGARRAPNEPRPLYGEDGQAWNIAYSFDCDGDDDIELFVRRQSPKRAWLCACVPCLGSAAGSSSSRGSCRRGCHADLRPLRRPGFHLSLLTQTCCRLANLALPVLLPSLAVQQLGLRARLHTMAALPAVAGVGGMLFGLAVIWEASWEPAADAPADSGFGRSRRRLLSVVSAVAAAGFLLLSWGRSQWWLMLGCLSAGYGAAGASWAQRFATADAMGGATSYRARPLLCVLTGLATVLAPAFCDLELTSCMAILAAIYTAISALWLLQPHVARFC